MGVLTSTEINRRLQNGELIRSPRTLEDGSFDVEVDSYDLAAGTAIWRQPDEKNKKGNVNTLKFLPDGNETDQLTVTVQPGQMVFVVTREDVLMPTDLCGTVYSRNSLALKGILALNAGHVDPGYEGPIAIRLINLRANPWTLTLGEPIFTITFQTLASDTDVGLITPRRLSQNDMVLRVRNTADAALSNALYDLYALNVEERLNDFRHSTLKEIRDERDELWVRKDKIWSELLSSLWRTVVAVVVFFAIVLATAFAGIALFYDPPGG